MKNKVLSFTKSFRFIINLTYEVDKKIFFLNSLFFILTAFLPLLSLWMLKQLVDKIVLLKSIFDDSVYGLVILFILIQLLQAFLQQLSSYFLQKQQYLISEHISLRVLNKAAEIDFAFYEDPSFYDSLHLTQNKSSYLPSQIISTFQTLIQQTFLFISLAFFLFSIHWAIPLILLFLSFPMALSKLLFGRKQFVLERSIVPMLRKGQDLFIYITTNVYAKELRLYSFGRHFTNLFMSIQESIFQKRNKLQYIFMKKSLFVTFFEVLCITSFYLLLIQRSLTGAITIGGLIVYFQAFQRLQISISGIFNSVVSLYQHQLYLQELIKYFSLPARIFTDGTLSGKDLQPELIEIRNLSFIYPGTQKEILKNINMSFSKGKFIAIVGENGSGKSTLLKLLCGLYKINDGEILFSGKRANQLSPTYFSDNISVVFQDFCKYYMTVEDNVAIGGVTKDPVKIDEALISATGGMLIQSLHAGIETTLGRTHKLGEELSGGQWQKIAIARALYKDCPVLILDEPTSAIDPLAELEFFRNLREKMKDKLIILITHRLYNLKMADFIYVMEEARIQESGTFNDLIIKNGYFSKYYNAQKI
jgi:ATP-binding cassette, subfamily B, bacterial